MCFIVMSRFLLHSLLLAPDKIIKGPCETTCERRSLGTSRQPLSGAGVSGSAFASLVLTSNSFAELGPT